jgi:hypothetical protein
MAAGYFDWVIDGGRCGWSLVVPPKLSRAKPLSEDHVLVSMISIAATQECREDADAKPYEQLLYGILTLSL